MKYLEELLSNEDIRQEKRELIKKHIQDINEKDGFIDSISMAAESIKEKMDIIAKR